MIRAWAPQGQLLQAQVGEAGGQGSPGGIVKLPGGAVGSRWLALNWKGAVFSFENTIQATAGE